MQKDKKCHYCDGEGNSFCWDCNKYICDNHIKTDSRGNKSCYICAEKYACSLPFCKLLGNNWVSLKCQTCKKYYCDDHSTILNNGKLCYTCVEGFRCHCGDLADCPDDSPMCFRCELCKCYICDEHAIRGANEDSDLGDYLCNKCVLSLGKEVYLKYTFSGWNYYAKSPVYDEMKAEIKALKAENEALKTELHYRPDGRMKKGLLYYKKHAC